MNHQWYERPLDQRAKPGGEIGLNGKFYHGGEIMPFYVPRYEMPQVRPDQNSGLLRYLRHIPVGVEHKLLPPSMLKPHQRINRLRVEEVKVKQSILDSPCWVSNDYFILDGNHRWEAHNELHTDVPSYVIDLTFEGAINALFRFPGITTSQS